jgi:hypothetical protein
MQRMIILWAMDIVIFVLVGWQQQIDYTIQARLHTDSHTLTATERVRYCNASSGKLDTLFFHLYANAFRDMNTTYAREARIMGDDLFIRSDEHERGWIDVSGVLHENQTIPFSSESTLLVIPLPASLVPGDSIVLDIAFTLVFPKFFSRLGSEGEHYEAVQWYPKACVFDDDGWHLDTYHALGEFYGEFATYDVRIDLPGNYIVAATGDRRNPDDRAFIDALAENQTSQPPPERREVRFCAAAVHDFAWVCDPDYRIRRYEEEGVSLNVFYLKHHEKKWRNAANYARDAVRRYTMWYGPYPYNSLSIAESHVGGGMEYPMIVLVGSGEDNFTRLFEVTLIHELAHQWFYGVLGNNELEEAWLDEGFAAYSEMRYLEDKYEDDGWLLKVPFPVRPSRRYFHQLVYYIIQTNGLESPVLTPAYRFVNAPIAYENSAYSKPALFLRYLNNYLGHDTFDVILKRYCQNHRFEHVKSEDFIAVCEKESGQDLGTLFEHFLGTTYHCDWSVQDVDGRRVRIKNNGTFNMPVDVLVTTEKGPWVYAIGADCDTVTITVPAIMGNVKSVAIDPAGYAIEPDRWNNHYPRKVVVRPFFGLPLFDAYQISILPYLWYGSYDGVKTGLYLLGSEFIDFGFLKGRHQWFVGGNYGLRSEYFYPTYSYQTPLVFEHGKRIRIFLEGSNSRDRDNLTVGLRSEFGNPFSSGRQTMHESAIVFQEMKAYLATDSIDWELGTNVTLVSSLGIEHERWSAACGISFAHRVLGSDWNFLKVTGEVTYRSRTPLPFTARLFMGQITGTAPRQERLFLSGALRITPIADIVFGQSGYWSPQDHIHIPGEGNMRGYQTMHIKADEMVCMNLELLTHLPVRVFADMGYYEKPAFDIGCRLVLGPVSLNIPFYTLTDADWELRWSIGLP